MSPCGQSEFLHIFKVRREYCQALLELSRQQRELIDTDDYPQLLELLGQKQRLLGRLEELGKLRPRLWEEWHDERERLDSDSRADCDRVLADAEAVLSQLLDEENASTNLLSRRRDETQRQLQAISAGAQAHSAYHDNLSPATPRHLDIGQ